MVKNEAGLRLGKFSGVLSLTTFVFVIMLLFSGTCSNASGDGISSSKPILVGWYGDEGSVDLSWSYIPPDGVSIDGYIVQYSEDDWFSTYTNITVDGDETGISVDGLDDGTTYYFRIAAYDGPSYSQWSDIRMAEAGMGKEGLGIPWYWLPAFILGIVACVALVVFVIYKVIKLRRI